MTEFGTFADCLCKCEGHFGAVRFAVGKARVGVLVTLGEESVMRIAGRQLSVHPSPGARF